MDNEITAYFKGIKTEWGKITWPDRKQVIVQTVVVILVVAAFTIITFGLDIIFKGMIQLVCKVLNIPLQ